MEITVDVDDLLKWSRYLNRIPRKTKAAIARGLNTAGEGIRRATIHYIAQQADLAEDDVAQFVAVKEATPDDLEWTMDSSALAPPSLDWSRPWDRGRDSSEFEGQTLCKICTMEDELVCKICQDAAEHSPYTLTEARAMLPLHPHCRCVLQSWSSVRKLPVTFAGSGAPPELFTMRQLGEVVAGELQIALRATDGE